MASCSVLSGGATSRFFRQWRTTLAGWFPKNVSLSAKFLWEGVHGPEAGLLRSSLQLSLPHTGSISLSSFGDYFILFFLKKRNLKRRADEIETEFDSNLIWLDLALLTDALTEGQFPKLYFPLKYLKASFKIKKLCSWLLPRLLRFLSQHEMHLEAQYLITPCSYAVDSKYSLLSNPKIPQTDLPSLQ